MPEISRFYGIIVRMFFDDHPPPHIHVDYSGHKAVVDIASVSLISGSLPPRAMGLLTEWAMLHNDELLEMWQRAERLEAIGKIEPLP